MLLLLCSVSLQLFWLGRVALMTVVDPQSTSFQRSEIWRLLQPSSPQNAWRRSPPAALSQLGSGASLTQNRQLAWAQEWVDDARISPQLKRAVIASEDAGFTEHGGIDWDALEQAWSRNERAQARATSKRAPKVVGGSTITQQLAKNLFLSGERTLPRKAQELLLSLALEALLPKRRILEIYLNHVEWGEGLFGAQAAAQHYFGRDAARLDATASARLAVMLPAPKRFERQIHSAYVTGRAATIVARMPAVELP